MTIWSKLSRSGGFKYNERQIQAVLNERPFQKVQYGVLPSKNVDGKLDY